MASTFTPRRRRRDSHLPIARIARLEEWPAPDRMAWEVACRQATPLTVPGGAVKWSAATQKTTLDGWGRYLGYLDNSGELDVLEGPSQRLTPQRCTDFITSLRDRLSPNSVDSAVVFLGQAISVLAPDQAWGWVRKHPLRPRQKEVRAALVPKSIPNPARLLLAALDLCDQVDAEMPTQFQAEQFRDGVLVAFAVCVAVRRRNIAETRIGENLILVGQAGRLVYRATKTGEPFDVVLSPLLVDLLSRYVERHRPVLLALSRKDSDRLWISCTGRPMEDATIYNRFRQMVRGLTGQICSVHSVRHAFATTIMKADPRQLGIVAAGLGHRTQRTARNAYDRSGDSASNSLWGDLVGRIRRDGAFGPSRDAEPRR
jgi:hypothetical protein